MFIYCRRWKNKVELDTCINNSFFLFKPDWNTLVSTTCSLKSLYRYLCYLKFSTIDFFHESRWRIGLQIVVFPHFKSSETCYQRSKPCYSPHCATLSKSSILLRAFAIKSRKSWTGKFTFSQISADFRHKLARTEPNFVGNGLETIQNWWSWATRHDLPHWGFNIVVYSL